MVDLSEEERLLLIEAVELLIEQQHPTRVPGVGLVSDDRVKARKIRIADDLVTRLRLSPARAGLG